MSLINWNKPKKARSTEEHNKANSSDCGIAGTYASNMSQEDEESWKGKIVNKKTDHPHVELRKTFSDVQLLIIVATDNGYNYKYEKVEPDDRWNNSTKGVNVRMSMNGALQMTFSEMMEINIAIEEAYRELLI